MVSARLPYLQEKQTVTDLAGVGRAANNALHIIAIGRLRTDDKTKEYVAKQVAEGHTKWKQYAV